MLIHGTPSVVERKRIHTVHTGPTDMVEAHVDNEAILALEEVSVWTEPVLMCPRETQYLVIIFPTPAFLANVFEHRHEGCVLDQLVADDFDIVELDHLICKETLEVNHFLFHFDQDDLSTTLENSTHHPETTRLTEHLNLFGGIPRHFRH